MEYKEKQLQIIECAERLFAATGYEGTSVRDIAEGAEVNMAMISYYFGSKEKLLEAVLEYRMAHTKVRVESLLKDDTISPIKKIGILIDDYIERMTQNTAFCKIIICEQILAKNPGVIKLLYDLKKRNTIIIEELIKDGQEKGFFKKNIDVVFMVNTMTGTLFQMLISSNYYRDYNNLQEMKDEDFQQMLKRKLSIHLQKLFKAILTYDV
ncbi:TetR/AcrR family transcriptional regulator [Chitinophagaceae bacterium LWZ2-11]